jgi:hypothetical protein
MHTARVGKRKGEFAESSLRQAVERAREAARNGIAAGIP